MPSSHSAASPSHSVDVENANVAPTYTATARRFHWWTAALVTVQILVLAGLHAVAATYHYYIRRDGVLRRMLLRAGRYSLAPGQSRTVGSPPLPSTAPR
jgi:hypothetical protein